MNISMATGRNALLLGFCLVLTACGGGSVEMSEPSVGTGFAACETTVPPLQDVSIPIELREDIRTFAVRTCSMVRTGGTGVRSGPVAIGDTHLVCQVVDSMLTASNLAGLPTVATPGHWQFGGLRYHISAGLSEAQASRRRQSVQRIFVDWLRDGPNSNQARPGEIRDLRAGCEAVYRASLFTEIPFQ